MRRNGRALGALALLLWACGPAEQAPQFEGEPPGLVNDKLAAAHILIQWEGVERQQLSVVRSRKEAKELAEELVRRARAGEDFGELAAEYSDDPTTARKRGEMGAFRPQKMISAFSNATRQLHYGEISDPIRTRQGFQIILRRPVEEIRARHLLIMHVDSREAPEEVTRDAAEARVLVESLRARALAGEDFAALIAEYSEAPDAEHGGELGPFSRGDMVEPFEDAAFALAEDEFSEVVETIYGFHIIQRLE